jgi:hypothetical protein
VFSAALVSFASVIFFSTNIRKAWIRALHFQKIYPWVIILSVLAALAQNISIDPISLNSYKFSEFKTTNADLFQQITEMAHMYTSALHGLLAPWPAAIFTPLIIGLFMLRVTNNPEIYLRYKAAKMDFCLLILLTLPVLCWPIAELLNHIFLNNIILQNYLPFFRTVTCAVWISGFQMWAGFVVVDWLRNEQKPKEIDGWWAFEKVFLRWHSSLNLTFLNTLWLYYSHSSIQNNITHWIFIECLFFTSPMVLAALFGDSDPFNHINFAVGFIRRQWPRLIAMFVSSVALLLVASIFAHEINQLFFQYQLTDNTATLVISKLMTFTILCTCFLSTTILVHELPVSASPSTTHFKDLFTKLEATSIHYQNSVTQKEDWIHFTDNEIFAQSEVTFDHSASKTLAAIKAELRQVVPKPLPDSMIPSANHQFISADLYITDGNGDLEYEDYRLPKYDRFLMPNHDIKINNQSYDLTKIPSKTEIINKNEINPESIDDIGMILYNNIQSNASSNITIS